MAGVGDILQGDGLARVRRALDGLEADALRLDHVRTCFNNSPPYTSNPSGTATRSTSLDAPNEE